MVLIGILLLLFALLTDVSLLTTLGFVLVIVGAIQYIARVRRETALGRQHWW